MSSQPSSLFEEGMSALAEGDWAAAARSLSEFLGSRPDPAAHFGLGSALWWTGDIRRALHHWTTAYQGFRRAGAAPEAVMAAIQLSFVHSANLGNETVAAGWVRRAGRLASQARLPLLDGWVALAESVFAADPERAVELGRRAHAVGVAHGDGDLEVSALTAVGLAQVNAGNTDEGCALLDEAMTAAVAGEADSPDTVVFTSCLMMRACCSCADFARVVHWVRALDDFIERFGNPYLHTSCRTHYGEVLAATGDWERAETELLCAVALASHGLPKVRADAAACLADLRITQGRTDEARGVIRGFEGLPSLAAVTARLQLLDGDPAGAETTLARGLERLGSQAAPGARLRELLGLCRLAAGDPHTAADLGRQITEFGTRTGCDIVRCRGQRLLGIALSAERDGGPADPDAARDLLEAALAGFVELDLPLDAASTRMALAEHLDSVANAQATAEARSAHAVFSALGAVPDADRAANWLRVRGATVARARGRSGLAGLTRRETEVLRLLGEGLSNPEIAERLFVSRRTVEHHVANILSKLGLRNRAEAAGVAVRHGDGLAPK
ncbi:helix-turn-helix transcriptional regulator [Nocardiopsis metallicus]|uniref:DNA-binding NarL/FixJ family response regulator n=1 Tax=Nocardiopsis metallicus TaxID=179819 RepID=A0A840WH82_9ACTN|nr:helix-turn-helix transcriptional regulator [Nocardiopsis metallicus]MBB5490796.1 DNA-binding NarL/FixJ family response regulator [Nocardiopsis metallicus]